MLWSPIVKNQGPRAKYNQLEDIKNIQKILAREMNVKIEAVINHEYDKCLSLLREYAGKETKELQSPVLRMMQIEYRLAKHLKSLSV